MLRRRCYRLRSPNVSLQQGTTPLDTGKANEVGAQTEARALARREANARGEEVEERERHRRHDCNREDLLEIELLLRDDKRRQRHGEALEEVFDRTRHELRNCETVHTYNLDTENVWDHSVEYRLKDGWQ